MSRTRILLVSLVSSIAILVLLVAYSIPGALKGDTSPNPPIVLHPSQLLPPSEGEEVHCRQKITATINGVTSEATLLNTLKVIDSTPETYAVEFKVTVTSKSGIFEEMETEFSGVAVLDSLLHIVIRYPSPSQVPFPVSLDFAGLPFLSNRSEIRSDDPAWMPEEKITFTPMAYTFKKDDVIKLEAKSPLSNGTFLLSASKWPYVKWLSVTTKESYRPIVHSVAVYVPSLPESGRIPPPLDVKFRTFDTNRTIVVEILD